MTAREAAARDRWTTCTLGHTHWGVYGGAGLLIRHLTKQREALYLLEQRSRSVDEGGTWGIPGGAVRRGESPEAAAQRETEEEIRGFPSHGYHVTGVDMQDCGAGWKFHIISVDVDHIFDAYCRRQTDAVGWFNPAEMWSLTLHPGFQRWVDAKWRF